MNRSKNKRKMVEQASEEFIMKEDAQSRDVYTDYGEIWSDVYDEYADAFNKPVENALAVSFLKSYVKNGTALELGVGNGHVALPLAETGASVHGLD
ncbi:class I SAM-dependent methyltransferase, partial [Mesorhizobium sp. M4A.F.Ca.ET.050.02.1.1]